MPKALFQGSALKFTSGELFGITIELHYIWRRNYKQGYIKTC